MTPRPIVVCEASPRAPTVTVRARAVGDDVARELVVDSLAIALGLLAPDGAAGAGAVRATPGPDGHGNPTGPASGSPTSRGA